MLLVDLRRRSPLDALPSVTARRWSEDSTSSDPHFFERHAAHQHPEFLWIGCSDSRVPAEELLGLNPGHVFVQRNVGNQVCPTDLNTMSCLEYAVDALHVKSILVCGHYRCGAVKAAMAEPPKDMPSVGAWIKDLRDCYLLHEPELAPLDKDHQHDRLCELNVLHQVLHVCSTKTVTKAWARGQSLEVYGLIYDVKDGMLKPIVGPIASPADVAARCFSNHSHAAYYQAAMNGMEQEMDTDAKQDQELSADAMRIRRQREVAQRYNVSLMNSKVSGCEAIRSHASHSESNSGSDEEGSYHPPPSVPDVYATAFYQTTKLVSYPLTGTK